jgi:hypothetical protein
MADGFRHKRGDTFLWLFVLPEDEYPDGYFVGWEVAAQIRTSAGNKGRLVADLDAEWGDPAESTRILMLSFDGSTTGWPVGDHELDVQFTRLSDGTIYSSDTLPVEITKDITIT